MSEKGPCAPVREREWLAKKKKKEMKMNQKKKRKRAEATSHHAPGPGREAGVSQSKGREKAALSHRELGARDTGGDATCGKGMSRRET